MENWKMETSPTTDTGTAPGGSGTKKGLRNLIANRRPQVVDAADRAVDRIMADNGVRPILTVAAFQSSI
jgi:hypothetical protein